MMVPGASAIDKVLSTGANWGASREPVEALMNSAALIAMLPAVNNGWAFAAFVLLLAVSIYLGRRDAP
jgi:hypothetical protein